MSVLKVDLHVHTSEDPVDNLTHDARAVIDRAAALGFGAVAITLHDRQLRDGRLTDYALDRGVVLIRGIERTVEGRHVLLLNFPDLVEQACTFGDIARLKARSNGLVIAPHPFFPGRTCLRRLMDRHEDLFDAVEWSYFWTAGANFNAAAERWARAHAVPLVGNSDLHDLRQLGRTYSLVEADAGADADTICEAIRHGRVTLQTSAVPPHELASVLGGMLWRGRSTAPRRAAEGVLGA